MKSCTAVVNSGQVRVNINSSNKNGCCYSVIASADETVQVVPDKGYLSSATKMPPPITHPLAVRAILPLLLTDLAEPYLLTGAGDVIRIYDVSSDEPELIGEVDAHWHDVTAIRLWIRKTVGKDGKTRVEPWIISASLDGTIRRWRLSGRKIPLHTSFLA